MNDFFDTNTDQLDRFSDEVREKLRLLSEDIEREVSRSLVLLQKLEQMRGMVNGAPVTGTDIISDFPSVGRGPDNSGILGGVLDGAIGRAASGIIGTGTIDSQSVIRSGASSIGSVLGHSVADSGGMRLSISQIAREFSRQLGFGSRNN